MPVYSEQDCCSKKCASLRRPNSDAEQKLTILIGHLTVRILLRQPGILAFGEFSFLEEKGPPNAGFSRRQ
jgi:hypothetical protein